MEKESKNNEVYKIEIEIDDLTKEQYESIWAKLIDISGHSGKEITMKGGLANTSDESSGLHKHVVNGCCFITADNFEIDPITTKVYFYPTWATDGYPSRGLMEFDNKERKWKNYHNSDVPVFLKRENVNEYIKSRHCR